MKILVVNKDQEGKPRVTLMADSSLLRSGQPFFIPDYTPALGVEPMLALRIGRLGKCIAPRFAHRYIDAATACFIVKPLTPTSDDMLAIMDGATMMGGWETIDPTTPLPPVEWSSSDATQEAASPAFDLGTVIAHLSQRTTLKMGDVVCITLGATLHPIAINDTLQASINGHQVIKNKIK